MNITDGISDIDCILNIDSISPLSVILIISLDTTTSPFAFLVSDHSGEIVDINNFLSIAVTFVLSGKFNSEDNLVAVSILVLTTHTFLRLKLLSFFKRLTIDLYTPLVFPLPGMPSINVILGYLGANDDSKINSLGTRLLPLSFALFTYIS